MTMMMMRTFSILAAAAVAASSSSLLSATPSLLPASAAFVDGGGNTGGNLDVIGYTAADKLIRFRTNKPRNAQTIGDVSGYANGETSLIGLDFRPANGALVAVGNAGGIYTVDTDTALLTFVAVMSVPPTGASFGVDFNPTVDRLRIVSNTGQNLRVNVDTGATLVDTALTYPGPPVVSALGVVASAYTNNDADPNTATTLFDIDLTLDQVVVQSPANSGLLAATGKLGVDAGAAAGFDIYSVLRDGTTVDARAYAALTVGGTAGFYRISLLTGNADLVNTFKSSQQVVDIAIPLNQGDDDDGD